MTTSWLTPERRTQLEVEIWRILATHEMLTTTEPGSVVKEILAAVENLQPPVASRVTMQMVADAYNEARDSKDHSQYSRPVAAVADRYGMSRSQVSRLLSHARQQGLVTRGGYGPGARTNG